MTPFPEPAPPPKPDFGRRALSVYDLEKTLCVFLKKIVEAYRFDNPTLNLAMQPGAFPKSYNPDEPPVSYDPTARAQTLALKVMPRVERGRVPRSVTGEVEVDRLPDFPAIIVQAVSAHVDKNETITTVRIFVNMYDENPDSGGYQDCLNIAERIAMELTSYGQQGIDQAYVIVMPIEWKLIEADTFPHYIAEMTTQWELPSARPLPDSEIFGIVPAEHIDLRGSYDTSENYLFDGGT
jgi:hypothetical protein